MDAGARSGAATRTAMQPAS